jgi:ribosomal protein S18 acetylase RimI-like enzyme
VHVRTWQAAYAHVFGAKRLAGIELDARERRCRERLATPSPHEAVFVAETAGSVVGFASCGESRDAIDEGELYAIYVLPESWGSGAGQALMAATLASLRASGFATASLWVLDDNPPAQRFYEREGWKRDGGVRKEDVLGVQVTEVRYRIRLG